MQREEDGMDDDKILQLDTGKVVEISDYLPDDENIHPGEQSFHDGLARSVQMALDDGLTAAQIVGVLYLVMRRFSEQADEW